jgi:hypothetical protein
MASKVPVVVCALVAAAIAPASAEDTSCTMELHSTSIGVGRRCPYTAVGTTGTLTLDVTEGVVTVVVRCIAGGASLTGTPANSPQTLTFVRAGECGSLMLGLALENSAVATAN